MVTANTPQWLRDAVFYQIFPDRFAKSSKVKKPANIQEWNTPPTHHGFKGGDLVGVIEKLDYLQELGITAIYFNPIFASASNHRYHTFDYYQIDPLLGTEEDFDNLVNELHKRDMKIVLDGVFNHASRGFFQFNHILECGEESPYFDWFVVKGFPLNAYEGEPNYQCWYDLPALPEFNTDNPEVREYLFDIAKYWIDKGIDGWRLDVAFCIDDDAFWQEFRSVVKNANPDAYITGEIMWDASRWLQGDQFDAVMNYLLTFSLWGFIGGNDFDKETLGSWVDDFKTGFYEFSLDKFATNSEKLMEMYPLPNVMAQLNLIDSHDTPRFLELVDGRKDLLYLAYFFIFTYPGAPCIYYGDEIGMRGAGDPDCRRTFPWNEKEWDKDLLEKFKELISLRKAHSALRSEFYKVLYAKNDLIVYQRKDETENLIAILNRAEVSQSIEFDLEDEINSVEILLGNEVKISKTNTKIKINSIPALSAIVVKI
jgi:neopullulanase